MARVTCRGVRSVTVAKKKSTSRKKTATRTTKTTRTTRKSQTQTGSGASKDASASTSGRSSSKSGKKKPTRHVSAGEKGGNNGEQRAADRAGQPPAPAPAAGAHVPSVPPEVDHFNGQQLPDEELRKVKTGLSAQELQKFRSLLLEKRAELIGDVESLQNDARNEDASISYEHMADVGTDSYEQEFTLGLVESERKLLREIDESLDRINKDTYGVCIISGEPIGKPRLEAKPWAKYSITVAREREKRGLSV